MTAPSRPLVLIVDDEKIVAETLSAIVKNHGFNSKAVHSGEAALAECHHTPAIVVADVMMGDISGIELAIQLRKLHPNCRVLLMSGAHAASALLDSAQEQGYDFDIIAKPFHPSQLLQWIANGSTREA